MKWIESLSQTFEVSGSIPVFQDETLSVEMQVVKVSQLHCMLLSHQKDWKSQGMLAAKSRLSKRTLTVPRHELVAAQMATNFMWNTRSALNKYPDDRCYAWTDSTVVFYWLKTKRGYKEFATNRV